MLDRITKFLGYDAVASTGRRRPPQTRIKSEDLILNDASRRKLIATSQDANRNFAIASWAIRKHLDFVSSFSFQARTGTDFDDELEAYMSWWGQRQNCDVRRRHPFRRMVRLAEARRVVDGDFFFLKLVGDSVRGALQAIEADRIATPQSGPPGFKVDDFTNGIRTYAGGASKDYCICRRTDYGNLEYERIVTARDVFAHGFYDRFDQVRGVSPIAAALNCFADTHEGFNYALAKIKVSQLFGLVFYRDAETAFQTTRATIDADDDGISESGYEVDFGAGPVQLDLNPGDKAEFLESRSPATETVEFLKLMVHVALKSLDIPYSFFDESFTNFFGSRAGLIQYAKSCKHKIADLQELLDEITAWRLGLAIYDGELTLPRGVEFSDLRWEWVPDGTPWWNPIQEVKGATMAIAAGLDTPQRVCRETGTDFYENVDAIAEAIEYAKTKGVPLQLASVGSTPLDGEIEDTAKDNAQEEGDE